MIDRTMPHVGHGASVDEALHAALRQATLPSAINISASNMVRESAAEYTRLCA